MNAELQEIVALGIVALAAVALLVRQVKRRKQPGCSGGCACPAKKLQR
jgi:hypothetical protein